MKQLVLVPFLLSVFCIQAADLDDTEPFLEGARNIIYAESPGSVFTISGNERSANIKVSPRLYGMVALLADLKKKGVVLTCVHARNLYAIGEEELDYSDSLSEQDDDASKGVTHSEQDDETSRRITQSALEKLGWKPYGTIGDMIKHKAVQKFFSRGCDSFATDNLRRNYPGTPVQCLNRLSKVIFCPHLLKDKTSLRYVYLLMDGYREPHFYFSIIKSYMSEINERDVISGSMTYKVNDEVFAITSKDVDSDEHIKGIAKQLEITYLGPVTLDNIADILYASELHRECDSSSNSDSSSSTWDRGQNDQE